MLFLSYAQESVLAELSDQIITPEKIGLFMKVLHQLIRPSLSHTNNSQIMTNHSPIYNRRRFVKIVKILVGHKDDISLLDNNIGQIMRYI